MSKATKATTAPGTAKAGPGGFNAEEIAALTKRADNPDKTPDAVLAAWCAPITAAGGFELKPYTAQHRLVLESTESPFVKPGAANNSAITYADIATAIYMLGQTGEALFDAGPIPQKELVKRLALILQKLPGDDTGLAAIRKQICRHLASSTVTIIVPGEGAEETGGPLAESRPTTAITASAPAAVGS